MFGDSSCPSNFLFAATTLELRGGYVLLSILNENRVVRRILYLMIDFVCTNRYK